MFLQTPILSRISTQNEPFLLDDLLEHFLSLPPISESRSDELFFPLYNRFSHLQPSLLQQTPWFRPSSPIGSKGALNLLLAACKRAEEEQQAETREVLEESSEAKENKAFTQSAFHLNDSNSESLILETESTDIENEDDWKDDVNDSQHGNQSSWIDVGNTP